MKHRGLVHKFKARDTLCPLIVKQCALTEHPPSAATKISDYSRHCDLVARYTQVCISYTKHRVVRCQLGNAAGAAGPIKERDILIACVSSTSPRHGRERGGGEGKRRRRRGVRAIEEGGQ